MVGRGDHHHIDILALQHPPVVPVCFHVASDAAGGFIQVRLVHVAKGGDAKSRIELELRDESGIGADARADKSDRELVGGGWSLRYGG